MAMCLILMTGRFGAMAGSNIIAYLLTYNCNLIFILFGGSLLGKYGTRRERNANGMEEKERRNKAKAHVTVCVTHRQANGHNANELMWSVKLIAIGLAGAVTISNQLSPLCPHPRYVLPSTFNVRINGNGPACINNL
uniref:Uncharacterized protein n=1 Tax=Anopheles minimus TaxID=112268 RepID=A0A182VVC5_9DIPT